jgi:hypothetical protein
MRYSQSPLAEQERQAAERSSARSGRDHLNDRSDQRSGARSGSASIHAIHSSGRNGDQVASRRPSLGRRIFRSLTRFLVTIFIGVGGTLAWQSYGDVARETVITRAPALSWLLSALPAKPPIAAAYANPTQGGFPASGLDALRRSVEQLAVRQEQMAQNMAALQAIEEDIRQKMSFTPASMPGALTQPAAPVAQPRPMPRAPVSFTR